MNDVNDDPMRGYRPAGPPPDLRARIMREADRATSAGLREWLPAFAVAALIVLLTVLNQRMHADIDARLAVPDNLRPVEQWLPDDVRGLR